MKVDRVHQKYQKAKKKIPTHYTKFYCTSPLPYVNFLLKPQGGRSETTVTGGKEMVDSSAAN